MDLPPDDDDDDVRDLADDLILEAAASGDLEKLKEIRERIGDEKDFRRRCNSVYDIEGRRALHYAAGMGLIDMCRFLIEQVEALIDVITHTRETPLLHAMREGHFDTAKYLINQGAGVGVWIADYKGFTSLHYAVQRDNQELMQLLLTKGASIDAISLEGTPLHCAASRGNVETLKFLLDHGAEPKSCAGYSTPLLCAIKAHSFECTKLLLEAGADPKNGVYGLSPLQLAAAEGETESLKCFLEAGADPNDPLNSGLLPIEHAALEGHREGVRILFPVSPMLPQYPDWSVDGIMEFVNSKVAKAVREAVRQECLESAMKEAKAAWDAKDYKAAVAFYSQAIYHDPSDEKLLCNRSVSWALLDEGRFALSDAHECIRLKPEWGKAYYREGAAWKLLMCFRMSSEAFGTAATLDPKNEEFEKAYRDSFEFLSMEV